MLTAVSEGLRSGFITESITDDAIRLIGVVQQQIPRIVPMADAKELCQCFTGLANISALAPFRTAIDDQSLMVVISAISEVMTKLNMLLKV